MECLDSVGPEGYNPVVMRGPPAAGTFVPAARRPVLAACNANGLGAMEPMEGPRGVWSHRSPTATHASRTGAASMPNPIRLYEEHGQSPWLDDLTRPALLEARWP